MSLSTEQQQAIDAQKSQCPFCKIIRGEIEARKVYEDEKFLGILDINPASKGHTLFMPKEHYPIMPLIPPDVFKDMVLKLKHLSKAIKQAMVTNSTEIFIANGAAAGQQSQHFMVHIIPREEHDGLANFDAPLHPQDPEKYKQVFTTLSRALPPAIREYLKRTPMPGITVSIAYTKDELVKLIEQNPPLKKFILEKPDEFKRQVPQHPQLKPLFQNLNIDEIIREIHEKNNAAQKPSPSQQTTETSAPVLVPPESRDPTHEELFEIIDNNPVLKDLLLTNLSEFKKQVAEIEQLQQLFGHLDLDVFREKFKEHAEGKEGKGSEPTSHDKKDLDIVARLMEYGM